MEILSDILDIAKIESGQLTLSKEECNLDELFNELSLFFDEYKKRLGKQHLAFHLKSFIQTSHYPLILDTIKVKQILINLISNSFKFTESGFIEGGCKLDPRNRLLFYVKDSGMGIPEDKFNVIFERFTQLNQNTSQFYAGTGLGLSIVKGLVNLMGGEIWIESELNQGSTFYVALPFERTNTVNKNNYSSAERNFDGMAGKTILVVEDDLYNTLYIKEILAQTKLHVLFAGNGKRAIEMARSESPELILMDIRLPDISGYEAIQQILQHKPTLPIIAQTAYATAEDRQKSLNAGCVDYISKPINLEKFLQLIHYHFNKSN